MTFPKIDPRMVDFLFTPTVTSVTAIKSDSLNPDDYPIARLRDVTFRDQEFEWLLGDYTTRVAADVYNGRYIKKDAVSAASGAWVARPKAPTMNTGPGGRFSSDTWHSSEFDVPNVINTTDASPYLTAMINLENIDKPGYVQYSNGNFELFSQLPERTYQCTVRGKRNGGFQDTIVRKRYTEFSSVRGIFAFKDVGVTLEDIAFAATDGVTGGSAISMINDTGALGPGDLWFDNVYVSCGDQIRQSLYVDGQAAVGGSPPDGGLRNLAGVNCSFFGAAVCTMHFVSVKHFFFTNTFSATSGGTGPLVLRIFGAANNVSDDFLISGIVSGDAELNYAERGRITSPQIGNVTGTNCANVVWDGKLMSGTTSGIDVIRPVAA